MLEFHLMSESETGWENLVVSHLGAWPGRVFRRVSSKRVLGILRIISMAFFIVTAGNFSSLTKMYHLSSITKPKESLWFMVFGETHLSTERQSLTLSFWQRTWSHRETIPQDTLDDIQQHKLETRISQSHFSCYRTHPRVTPLDQGFYKTPRNHIFITAKSSQIPQVLQSNTNKKSNTQIKTTHSKSTLTNQTEKNNINWNNTFWEKNEMKTLPFRKVKSTLSCLETASKEFSWQKNTMAHVSVDGSGES